MNKHTKPWAMRTIIALAILTATLPTAGAVESKMPFAPGEKLEYQLRWESIPAGKAWLEVHAMKEINGEPTYHFVMRAESNGFVDIFYKVRDRIDAYADVGMNRSMRYEKKQREGEHHKEEIILFDWKNNKAQYSNYGKKETPIDLMAGSFDPLSAFYFTRTADFSIGGQLERAITDGQKNVIGRLKVVARETITTFFGKTYDTYRVEPEMNHVGGVFKESKDAKIELWVTADEYRIPVRVKSKVAVGHFIGELISANTSP
ncbi:MAG: DUF3108 domain-containing protein [Desulfatitalea sp.]|nr:DUF3108 domain-containing protein [Desulfatitalea sp.]NNK01815.1 DUF3108 domain-containing protein [Desulfatitalea sp.]